MSRVTVNILDQLEAEVPNTGFLGTIKDGWGEWGVGILVAAIILIVVTGGLIWWKKKGSFRLGWSWRKIGGLGISGFVVVTLVAVVYSLINSNDNGVSAAGDENRLSISTEDVEINVALGNMPTYAMVENRVRVDDATNTGYTLMAYIDGNTDVLSSEGHEIEGVAEGNLGKLSENTWGVAINKPDSQENMVWQGLPKGLENAMIIKEIETKTAAGDSTSLYYGTYVTPDMPHGMYDGVTVQYVAVANPVDNKVKVRFHGNGAKFAPGLEDEMTNWGEDDYAMLEEKYEWELWQYILKYPTASDVNTVEYEEICTEESCEYKVSTGQYDVPYTESAQKVVMGLDNYYDYNRESWSAIVDGKALDFNNEEEIIEYLSDNGYKFYKTGLDLYLSANRIIYDGNGATWGTMDGFVTRFYGNIYDEEMRLVAPNFKKDGYGFAGWSTNRSATVDGGSKIYGPNERVNEDEFDFGATHSATLYAVWVPSSGSLQNWNGCGGLSVGEVVALTDMRDGNVYTVGKMVDENCWMMENLRLRSENSKDALLAQGYGGVFVGLADSENENYGTAVANSLYGPHNIIGDRLNERIPRYNHINTSVNNNVLYDFPGNYMYPTSVSMCRKCRWFGYGNYYNFAAANANTELVELGVSDMAETSICPQGWSLPMHSNNNDVGGFEYLDMQLGGSGSNMSNEGGTVRWLKYPVNMILAGRWAEYDYSHPGGGRANTSVYRGLAAYFQTSAPGGLALSYAFGSENLQFYWGMDDYKNTGIAVSVRCLAR